MRHGMVMGSDWLANRDFFSNIFSESSVVLSQIIYFLFGCVRRKPEVLLQPWRLRRGRRCRAKTLTFCNMTLITEDIYLKIEVCIHYLNSNPNYQGR